MNVWVKTCAVLLPMALLWGCTTTPPDTSSPDSADDGAFSGAAVVDDSSDDDLAGVDVQGMDDSAVIEVDALDAGEGLLSQRVVYFAFDKSDITSDARAVIEAHSRYLAANPAARVTLEGHADERGTREYNLALGERRGKSVRQMMTLLGVSSRQLDVVSYGEERPVSMRHDEAAWEQNRRVELIYARR